MGDHVAIIIPYINQRKVKSYIKDFYNNSKTCSFLLLVNFVDFDLMRLKCESKTIRLVRKNFLKLIKQITNYRKVSELSKSCYVLYLSGYNSTQVVSLISEINSFINLNIKPDFVSLNCKMVFTEYKNSYDPESLLKKLILSNSSSQAGYFMEYQDSLSEELLTKKNIANLALLKKAIIEDKIIFAHQPIISCIDGNVEYFEYLMRIPDEEGNYISVGPIIPFAEKTGIINIINKLVVETAVKALQESDISIAVNISLAGVGDPELIELLYKLLSNNPISNRLIIEITETFFNDDFEQIKQFISVVRKVGSKIALDDFGSGWTSFTQLMDLPIDIIKLDGRYIRNLKTCKNSRVLVECLVKIANTIGAKTVAEFVENKEIAQLLQKLHVNSMQGNYFSPALLKK